MHQAQELNRVYEKKLEEKSREANLVREANKKLEALSQNKQLRDRGTLEMELQEVKMHLQSRDTEVRVREFEPFSYNCPSFFTIILYHNKRMMCFVTTM